MSNISCWPINRTLSGTTTPCQSGPESNGNEGVPRFPQSSKTGASPSDCLVSYPGHSLEESYPSTEMQLVYSTAQADTSTGHSLGMSYPLAEMQSVYSTDPADGATGQPRSSERQDLVKRSFLQSATSSICKNNA